MHYKASVMRYLYLYKYGGVYADPYVESLQRIDSSLADNHLLLIRTAIPGGDVISDVLMASIPGHSFWAACLNQIIINIIKNSADCETDCISGSEMLTQTYALYIADTKNAELLTSIRFLEREFNLFTIISNATTKIKSNCNMFIN